MKCQPVSVRVKLSHEVCLSTHGVCSDLCIQTSIGVSVELCQHAS